MGGSTIPSFGEAASLYIDPAVSHLNRGDSIGMAVRLDTDEATEECVNAVDAVITYSDNIEPVDISIGDSIFSMWVERPKINNIDRTITFAGGIPNGYCGRVQGDPRLSNVLAEIIFRSPGFVIGGGSPDKLNASVSFAPESTAYLNDGQGTKAPLMTYGAEIELSQKAGATMLNSWQEEVTADEMPPEKFSINLVKGEGNFSDKYYIVFETTDKQTGIDHYEVMEEPLAQFGSFQWGRADAPWIIVEQPPIYVLEDQSLNSIIRVKAIDKAGNEYIATLVPDESVRTISREEMLTYVLGAGVALIILLLIAVLVTFFRKFRKNQEGASTDDNSDEESYEE